MRQEQLTIVFNLDTLGVELALQAIQSVLAKHQVPLTGFSLYGKQLDLTEAIPALKRAKRNTFNIRGQGFEFDLSCVRNFHLDFLSIKGGVAEAEIAWDDWLTQFIESPDFVMAWLADVEYEFWQNAQDPLQYTAKGKPFDHLPKKSNGLPSPLEQTVIDTSGNPGRRILCDGYYEVIGAVMWLGERFWRVTGTDKARVINANGIRTSYPSPGVVRLEAASRPFTSDKGDNGDIQRKLRPMLFPGRWNSGQCTVAE